MKRATVKIKSPYFEGVKYLPLVGYHWISAERMRLTKPEKNDLMAVCIQNTDGSRGAIAACHVLNFDELPKNLNE